MAKNSKGEKRVCPECGQTMDGWRCIMRPHPKHGWSWPITVKVCLRCHAKRIKK